jgi:hypothetical protein
MVMHSSAKTEAADDKPLWRSMAEVITPALTVAGILLYVLLRSYYGQFYGALGVNPDDVGLGYASTLTTSAGLLIFTAIAAVLYPLIMTGAIYGIFHIWRSRRDAPNSLTTLYLELKPGFIRMIRILLPITTAIALLSLGVWYSSKATHYANAVKQGQAIKFGTLPLTSFSIRATPAKVRLVGKANEMPDIEMLRERSLQEPPLLYLGHANGTAVLYDSTTQEAIYVPRSLITLMLSNCETPLSPRAACKKALE